MLAWSHDPEQRSRRWSLAAGLHTQATHIHHTGRQHGIQVALTPAGARALLGMPAGELAHQAVELTDLLPELSLDALAAAPDRDRPALLDLALLAASRRRGRSGMAPELVRAWQLLRSSHGSMRIGDLAEETGWSRRHLAERFGREFGVRPKEAARILRFDRSRHLLDAGVPLAETAAVCGFADQAHLTREWGALADYAPTEYLRAELPFLQDDRTATSADSPA